MDLVLCESWVDKICDQLHGLLLSLLLPDCPIKIVWFEDGSFVETLHGSQNAFVNQFSPVFLGLLSFLVRHWLLLSFTGFLGLSRLRVLRHVLCQLRVHLFNLCNFVGRFEAYCFFQLNSDLSFWAHKDRLRNAGLFGVIDILVGLDLYIGKASVLLRGPFWRDWRRLIGSEHIRPFLSCFIVPVYSIRTILVIYRLKFHWVVIMQKFRIQET